MAPKMAVKSDDYLFSLIGKLLKHDHAFLAEFLTPKLLVCFEGKSTSPIVAFVLLVLATTLLSTSGLVVVCI